MDSAAFLPPALRARAAHARPRVCLRRPRGRGGVVRARAASPADDADEFFLPALDVGALANNTVLGGDEPAPAPARTPAKGGAKPPPRLTVAQERLRQSRAAAKAAKREAEADHDFMQAARDAIAMASVPADVAGVADVSVGKPKGVKVGGVAVNGAPRGKSPEEKEAESTFDVEITASDLGGAGMAPVTVSKDAVGVLGKKAGSIGRSEQVAKLPTFKEMAKESSAGAEEDDGTEEGEGKGAGGGGASALRSPDFVIRPRDLVMHSRHGLGRFRGLERSTASHGPMQEYAVVEYRDGDVYVPLSQLDCLRRLSDEQRAHYKQLDVVSGSASYGDKPEARGRSRRAKFGQRQKARAKIREQIVNLSGLYAARDELKRPKYKAYPEEEAEFETRCEFRLTDDQQTAVNEVLNDVTTKGRPMDRLLCGDVGFGKTEVAVRCAFRILMAGKQVAILAPTTILAQQHYETFTERFKDYPDLPVVCLTRFLTRKATLDARKRIECGEARVIVGTHVLLGDTTTFNNLGLLVVDEEHRFGVNQKEKLRCKHREVDTLFMSATPIPRTLHLAISGLRDTSILKQPPPGRKPVITRVAASGAGVVRKALAREFDRDGQVFFVCPRIEGIEATASWISDLFPAARVLVAHGSHKDLERRIWAFAAGRYDVLVCTTIIENGINMPSVNTMIVQDAARFGMAQLHQLRGRVGRCELQAYAWLLYNQTTGNASSPARERLQALERFSGLGAGFAIAQRDMEMRGVGTVLGVDQHGYSTLDADEYSQMLVEELESAKTGKPVPMKLPNPVNISEVFLPVASYIPEDYIKDVEEKMAMYSVMSRASSIKQLSDIAAGLEKRYGPLPPAVHRHVCVMRLKLQARGLGIRRIFVEREHVVLDWAVDTPSLQRLVAFVPDKRARGRFECLEAEERVNLRGLGICSGDLQLAKLLGWIDVFVKASVNFKTGGETTRHADDMLVGLLDNREEEAAAAAAAEGQ